MMHVCLKNCFRSIPKYCKPKSLRFPIFVMSTHTIFILNFRRTIQTTTTFQRLYRSSLMTCPNKKRVIHHRFSISDSGCLLRFVESTYFLTHQWPRSVKNHLMSLIAFTRCSTGYHDMNSLFRSPTRRRRGYRIPLLLIFVRRPGTLHCTEALPSIQRHRCFLFEIPCHNAF